MGLRPMLERQEQNICRSTGLDHSLAFLSTSMGLAVALHFLRFQLLAVKCSHFPPLLQQPAKFMVPPEDGNRGSGASVALRDQYAGIGGS
jgi:hypothetical protein